MKKNKQVFLIDNPTLFKVQILHWSNQFEVCTFLDNHAYNSPYGALDCLTAVNPVSFIALDSVNAQAIDAFIQKHSGEWIFAHFNYEYQSITKPNAKANLTGFSLAYLYTPAIVIELTGNQLTIQSDSENPQILFDQISSFKVPSLSELGDEQSAYQIAAPKTSIIP